MTAWQPAAGPEAALSRADLLRRIRDYFRAAEVLEVDTPALSRYAVSDTHIESLEIGASSISADPLYLHTSPEFCMKRLLAAGYPDIYSICRVFRDGESGTRHQPEFTMVEWYRLGFDLFDIIDDTVNVITAALSSGFLSAAPAQYEYRSLFQEVVGVDPFNAAVDEFAAISNADRDLRLAIGEERDDWLDLILSARIAPTFAHDRLTVLRHYPASQAALARLCQGDPRCADRFEIFFGPTELANGYVELTDAKLQSRRIEQDNANRLRRGRPVRPADKTLLAALEAGLPACAGVALGLERLHMIHDKTDDIRDVITFAFEAGV